MSFEDYLDGLSNNLTPEQKERVRKAVAGRGLEASRQMSELRAKLGPMTPYEMSLCNLAFRQIQNLFRGIVVVALSSPDMQNKGASRVAEIWGTAVAESLIISEQFIHGLRSLEESVPEARGEEQPPSPPEGRRF